MEAEVGMLLLKCLDSMEGRFTFRITFRRGGSRVVLVALPGSFTGAEP